MTEADRARMRAFVESCIERDHKNAQEKSRQAPIHESGCYYYDYSLDAGWFCDCDGPEVAKVEAETKRALLALEDDRVLLLLALNYRAADGFDNTWAYGKGEDK